MRFHILTLFPDMVRQGLETSIIGRAVDKGLIGLNMINIRDFTREKHGRVDDYTYGGGAGMLMQAQPVFDAWSSVCGSRPLRTIYVTPQGEPFTQKKAREFAKEEELIILCGHYEGIDERVLEETVTDRISIGDYILTGGELAAMVIVDAVGRLVPGFWATRLLRIRRAFTVICWSIRNIPARRYGTGKGYRRCFCPGITAEWISGGWSGQGSGLLQRGLTSIKDMKRNRR